MRDTLRGLVVFAAALITIALWAPLSEQAEAKMGGGTSNEIYFGLFHYMTVHSEMKEPDYHITKSLAPPRLGATAGASAALWVGIIYYLRRTRISPADRTKA